MASHAKGETSKSDYGGHDSTVTEAWGSPQNKLLSTDNTAELQQENKHLRTSFVALERDKELKCCM